MRHHKQTDLIYIQCPQDLLFSIFKNKKIRNIFKRTLNCYLLVSSYFLPIAILKPQYN